MRLNIPGDKMACAVLLTASVFPQFNALVGKEFVINSLLQFKFVISIMAITLMTGIFAGSYPALFLSSFQPARVLRGTFSRGVKRGSSERPWY